MDAFVTGLFCFRLLRLRGYKAKREVWREGRKFDFQTRTHWMIWSNIETEGAIFALRAISNAVFTRDTFTWGKLTFLLYCVTFSIVKCIYLT